MSAAVSISRGFEGERHLRVMTGSGPYPVSMRMDKRVGEYQRFDSAHIERRLPYLLAAHPEFVNDNGREDAASGPLAFARGLEYIFKELIEVEFAELRNADFIPVNTEVPAGSLTATYRMYQKVGQAAVIGDNAVDLPVADVTGEEWPSPIITIGAAYLFTLFDALRAAKLEIPLESMKADACKFAIDSLDEDIAATGYPLAGVTGLTNAAGIAATNQISTGGTWLAQIAAIGAATAADPWSAVAVAQGIIADVNAMKSATILSTKGRFTADTLLLSTPLWAALQAVPRSPAFTDDNLIDYIRKVTQMDVDFWPRLDNAGAGNLGRVMCYCKNPRVLRNFKAMPFTQLPPQPKGLGWITNCVAQLGGVNVVQPLAVTYMDGLD